MLAFAAGTSAQVIESIYINGSASTVAITSETNSHGVADGSEASVSSNTLGQNGETWTFDFDNTLYPGAPLVSAEIYITHRQSGYVNDSLVFEYFDIDRSPGLFRAADSKTSNGTENTGRLAANQSLGANDGTT